MLIMNRPANYHICATYKLVQTLLCWLSIPTHWYWYWNPMHDAIDDCNLHCVMAVVVVFYHIIYIYIYVDNAYLHVRGGSLMLAQLVLQPIPNFCHPKTHASSLLVAKSAKTSTQQGICTASYTMNR